MSEADIQTTVRNSMRACAEHEASIEAFSFSLKPAKPLAEGGLALQPNNWHFFLDRLKDVYLPQTPPYSGLQIDQQLVDKTYSKDLGDTCYDLTLILTGSG